MASRVSAPRRRERRTQTGFDEKRTGPAPCPPNSGDWKTDIGDGAPKTATTDLIPEVSNLRARKGPRNAGLCAAQGEVSEFHECVAALLEYLSNHVHRSESCYFLQALEGIAALRVAA